MSLSELCEVCVLSESLSLKICTFFVFSSCLSTFFSSNLAGDLAGKGFVMIGEHCIMRLSSAPVSVSATDSFICDCVFLLVLIFSFRLSFSFLVSHPVSISESTSSIRLLFVFLWLEMFVRSNCTFFNCSACVVIVRSSSFSLSLSALFTLTISSF